MAEEKAKAEVVETAEAQVEKTAVAVEETAEAVVEEVKEAAPVQDPQEFLENFNWEKYEQGILRICRTQRA